MTIFFAAILFIVVPAFAGTATCILSIIGALIFSLIPQLISNNVWWLIVGGITAVCLVIAGIGEMLASSEADWQKLHE